MSLSFIKNNKSEVIIPKDSIRFRIISSSNDELDIKRKLELKSYIENEVYELVKNAKTKEESKNIIVNNLDILNDKIYSFLGTKDFKIDFGSNYFPKKIYKGIVYDEGYYESLVITLGEGKGNNWWCVLFPPLCLLEENDNTTDVEYKLFVSRIIDNFK